MNKISLSILSILAAGLCFVSCDNAINLDTPKRTDPPPPFQPAQVNMSFRLDQSFYSNKETFPWEFVAERQEILIDTADGELRLWLDLELKERMSNAPDNANQLIGIESIVVSLDSLTVPDIHIINEESTPGSGNRDQELLIELRRSFIPPAQRTDFQFNDKAELACELLDGSLLGNGDYAGGIEGVFDVELPVNIQGYQLKLKGSFQLLY